MAGKKKGRRRTAGGHKNRGRSKRSDADIAALPHALTMDSVWRQILPSGGTPLEEAQELVFQAYEASPSKGISLARKALAISPDCADAYTLLGNLTESHEEAIALYREGVAAGKRALGQNAFRDDVGMFWGLMETRPFMRALQNLAQRLWAAQRPEEAVEHYRELLRLNPNDNQGARHELATCLLELGRDQEATELFQQYAEEESAEWLYGQALVAFRVQGDAPAARKRLAAAQQYNPFVPAYLLGAKGMPAQLPRYIGVGDEMEAVSYAAGALRGWKATPGAITWLRNHLKVSLPEPPPPRRASWQKQWMRFAALPQTDEVWQVDIHRVDAALKTGAPWTPLIVDVQSGALLHFGMHEERPSEADLWENLLEAMLHPDEAEPHRPQRVQVRRKSLARNWQSKLHAIGVECEWCAALPQLEASTALAGQSVRMANDAKANRQLTVDLDALAALPQMIGEVWQAEQKPLTAWVHVEGDSPHRPWLALVANRDAGKLLCQDILTQPPGQEQLWHQLAVAMLRPQVDEPHRPGVVHVRTEPVRQFLTPYLQPLGIECEANEQLDMIDFVVDELSQQISGPDAMAALIDVPGMKTAQVASYFQAAAQFYRAAPWRHVRGDTAIKVVCPKYQTSTWYAVVMGQAGMTLGIALYEDWDLLKRMITGRLSEQESVRRTSGISMMFDEPFEMAPRDLDMAEQQGWDVAGPEAYPTIMRLNPGRNIRPPLSWELELTEAALRTIPEFLQKRLKKHTTTAQVSSGPIEVELEMLE